MYCIIAKTVLKNGARDRFLDAMRINAETSVRDEAGCLVFDIVEAHGQANTFYLYEIYATREALEQHKETEHYLTSRTIVGELIAAQSVVRADVQSMNPSR